MGVYIKGMEMPTCCGDCFVLDDYGDYPVCIITQEQRGYNFQTRERKMDKRPLVEVPPHGGLIDADVFTECLATLLRLPSNLVNGQWIVNTLREQPTIIPAEEGNE